MSAALLRIILQSVGRGVRIEPVEGQRQRLKFLNNVGLLAKGVFGEIQDDAQALETLFVMGTNRDALLAVIEHLKNEARAGRDRLSLIRSSFFVWPTCILSAVCCILSACRLPER